MTNTWDNKLFNKLENGIKSYLKLNETFYMYEQSNNDNTIFINNIETLKNSVNSLRKDDSDYFINLVISVKPLHDIIKETPNKANSSILNELWSDALDAPTESKQDTPPTNNGIRIQVTGSTQTNSIADNAVSNVNNVTVPMPSRWTHDAPENYGAASSNKKSNKYEIYHDTTFLELEKSYVEWARLRYSCRIIIGLVIIVLLICGAYLVFKLAKSRKDYIKSFDVHGECIITETHSYWVENEDEASGGPTPNVGGGGGGGRGRRLRRRTLLESGSTLNVDYKYKIYNVSACAAAERYDQSIFEFTKEYKEETPNIYQVGDIIQCQTNENCDEITRNAATHFSARTEEANWTIAGGVMMCIVSCCCCGCVMYILCFMLERLYVGYHRQMLEYYQEEWKKMKLYQKTDYFVSYYFRKYKLNLVNEINSLITDYCE
eukprot:311791_1